MTHALWIVTYFAVGVVVAVVVIRRGGRWRDGAVAWVVWPIALPALLFAEERAPAAPSSGRIRDAAKAVESAWQAVTPGDGKELDAVRAFVRRLEATEVQLAELCTVLSSAAPSVVDRLTEVKTVRERELHDGLRLLDDLSAQLVVLRFSRGNQQVDSGRMEEILARIESLAQLNAQDLQPRA